MSTEIPGERPKMETQKPKDEQVEKRPKTREELEETENVNRIKQSFDRKRRAVDSALVSAQELKIKQTWLKERVRIRQRTEDDGNRLGDPLIVEIVGLNEKFQNTKSAMEAQKRKMQDDASKPVQQKESAVDKVKSLFGFGKKEPVKQTVPSSDIATWKTVHEEWKSAEQKVGSKERMQADIQYIVNTLDLSSLVGKGEISIENLIKEVENTENRTRKKIDENEQKLLAQIKKQEPDPDLTKTQLYFDVKK